MAAGLQSASRYATQSRHRIGNDVQLQYMEARDFESHVANHYRLQGFATRMTVATGDQGIDVIAEQGTIRIGIQVKRYAGAVGNRAIQEVVAGLRHYGCTRGVVVTTGYFTKSACALAKSNDVELIDGRGYEERCRRLQWWLETQSAEAQRLRAERWNARQAAIDSAIFSCKASIKEAKAKLSSWLVARLEGASRAVRTSIAHFRALQLRQEAAAAMAQEAEGGQGGAETLVRISASGEISEVQPGPTTSGCMWCDVNAQRKYGPKCNNCATIDRLN